jgi:DNA polymerase phi
MPGKRARDQASGEVTENLAERKKQRTFTEHDGKLASLYEELADDDSDVRLKAAKELVSELLSNKPLDRESLERAIKRLIRGLCSPRKAARFGFFLGFTELLRQLYAADGPDSPITKHALTSIIKSLTKAEGHASGQVSCAFH